MSHDLASVDVIDAEDRRVLDEDANRTDLRKIIPDDVPPWDRGGREMAERELARLTTRVAYTLAEIGSWVALAKTSLPHKEWLEFLEQFGIGYVMATRAMRIAAMPEAMHRLPTKKAGELLSLNKHDLDELLNTGSVGSITLKGVEAMTNAQLRAEIKTLNGRIDKGREQLNKMRQRHDEVEAENEKLRDSNAYLKRELKKHEAFLEQVAITQAQITDLSNVIEKMEVASDVAPIIREQVAGLLRSIDRVIQKRPDLFGPEAAVEAQKDEDGGDE